MKIFWTKEAEKTYSNLLQYVATEWSIADAKKLDTEISNLLDLLVLFPNMFKSSSKKNIRIAKISKQTSLFYKIDKSKIILFTFWDNRQHKLPKL